MTSTAMPARFPATANDLATSVMCTLGQHLELGCRLTFDGRLDPHALRRAVRLSLDAQPVLGCELRTNFRTGWWERLEDLDARVPFSMLETEEPDREAVRVQTGTIAAAGPQAAVALLRSPSRDDLCLRISHNVADGQATKQYAYLLADLYSNLLGDPSYAPVPDLAGRPAGRDMWGRLSAEERRVARREPRSVMPTWVLPHRAVTGRGRTLRELRLGPERFSALKVYGKARGATVNEMLLTAFFRAVARSFPQPAGRPLSLAFSADHRRYLRSAEAIPITNLAITIWLGVECVDGEDFDGTLRRVVEQIATWRGALWGAKGAVRAAGMVGIGYRPMRMLMGAIARMAARTGKTSPIFTNIGILDEQRLLFGGNAPSAARLSGPAAWGASFVPTISTYRDVLTVSMGLCEEDMDPADVEVVLRSMDEELPAPAASAATCARSAR